MATFLFLLLFLGLLSAGMPIFLVLGSCAAVLFFTSGQPLIGAAQLVIDDLDSPTLVALPLFVMAASFMRFGGVARPWWSWRPLGLAAYADRWAS